MWSDDMVLILRTLISDMDTPPKYSDDRLKKLLLVSGQFVQTENIMPVYYTISTSAITITPDPTADVRDDAFINLTCLKSACLLASSSLLGNSANGISVIENNYKFDNRGKFTNMQSTVTTWCEAYKEAQWENANQNRCPGRAIIGPYLISGYTSQRFS
jgi:hypothetical protein